MLTELHIQNFALIDDLHLELGEGFNVLTGETGAGKSIVIDAIGATLGERLTSDFIRTGADRTVIEGVFDISENRDIGAKAEELGIEIEDGIILVSREMSRTGKSGCRINGRLSTVSVLKELTGDLVDIHGQHEHQSLLLVDKHIEAFDAWCGQEAADLRSKVAEQYAEWRRLQRELERLQTDARERAHMLDLYQFQRQEIEAAALVPGEEDELSTEKSRLANAEKLYATASEVYDVLSGAAGETGVEDGLSDAAMKVEQMVAVDPSLEQIRENLQTALFAAQEAHLAIRKYRDTVEFNPERLEQVEERLDLIRSLKRKYGDSIEDIIAYGQEAARKADNLLHSEELSEELQDSIQRSEKEYHELAGKLSSIRTKKAPGFAQAVVKELADLAMKDTRFEVSVNRGQPSPKGIDQVEFLISPNPGEPLKPLAKIASGGEMSRIMLALKTVMAGEDRIPTLIFDEVDVGIGGRVAGVLGEKLRAISANSQVICVTHLPQVASKANRHLHVEKHVDDQRTVVGVRSLANEDRVSELARMLGAAEGSKVAEQHAREMLES